MQHARWRHFGWVFFGLVVGCFLLWKFGAVGKGVGVVMLGMGIHHGVSFLRTILHPPGTFHLKKDALVLPAGLCRGTNIELSESELHHVFFLRKAVPWTKAGPVLVIEARGQVHTYPRDWFASDSDQRRIALALNRRLGRI
jgi:hypothetical protein